MSEVQLKFVQPKDPYLEMDLKGKIYKVFLPEGGSLAELHDALMHFKYYAIEKMKQNHQQENDVAEKIKEIEEN